MQLLLKIFSRMSTSVDPDQTAPEEAVGSGSALFVYDILSETLEYEILGHLPYYTQAFTLYFQTKMPEKIMYSQIKKQPDQVLHCLSFNKQFLDMR